MNWNSKADVNIVNLTTGAGRHMKVDIRDLVAIAKSGSQNQKFELFLEKGEGSVCFPPLRVT